MPLHAFAPAKINLSLHITGKRGDGYHLLHSLVAFTKDIGDRITVASSNRLELSLTGRFASSFEDDGETSRHSCNLVIRAAHLLADIAGIEAKAHIKLEKNLPLSSGIGGGSSDAAATIKALCALWEIKPDQHILKKSLLKLGADLPVCMAKKIIIMEGIGENLMPYKGLPALPILLVNPLIPCPTQTVFKNFKGNFGAAVKLPAHFETPQDFCTFAQVHLHNDLTAAAIHTVPEINEILTTLEKSNSCLYAGLSGSGATCFAIYPTLQEAENAKRDLYNSRKNWWIESGILGD